MIGIIWMKLWPVIHSHHQVSPVEWWWVVFHGQLRRQMVHLWPMQIFIFISNAGHSASVLGGLICASVSDFYLHPDYFRFTSVKSAEKPKSDRLTKLLSATMVCKRILRQTNILDVELNTSFEWIYSTFKRKNIILCITPQFVINHKLFYKNVIFVLITAQVWCIQYASNEIMKPEVDDLTITGSRHTIS